MKRKITQEKKEIKYSPTESKKEAERKKRIQEKRKKTININKRKEFVEMIYKKYEV